MKILKIVEKVLFLVAVALGVFALVMAPIIDKKVTSSIITPMAAYFLFGIGFSIVLFWQKLPRSSAKGVLLQHPDT